MSATSRSRRATDTRPRTPAVISVLARVIQASWYRWPMAWHPASARSKCTLPRAISPRRLWQTARVASSTISGSTPPRGHARTACGDGAVGVSESGEPRQRAGLGTEQRRAQRLVLTAGELGFRFVADVQDAVPLFEAFVVRAAGELVIETVPGPRGQYILSGHAVRRCSIAFCTTCRRLRREQAGRGYQRRRTSRR